MAGRVEEVVEVSTIACWVRHGQTDWNRDGRLQGQSDVPLNERGRQEAARCAAHLAALPWDAIVASPLARARETAEIIAARTELAPVALWDTLMERHYGTGEGLTWAERERRFPNGEMPGVEPYEALGARGKASLDRLAAEYSGQRVLVVAHGGSINAVLGLVATGTIGSFHAQLANCSLSWTTYGRSRWELGAYNQRVG